MYLRCVSAVFLLQYAAVLHCPVRGRPESSAPSGVPLQVLDLAIPSFDSERRSPDDPINSQTVSVPGMNHTIVYQPPSAMADSNQLSWHEALLALAAVAFNTMLQPCGSVCGFDPSTQMFLRVSPIVCSVDTLSILCHFAIELRRTGSPFRAAKNVMDARRGMNQSVSKPSHCPTADTSASLQDITPTLAAECEGSHAILVMKIVTFGIGTFFGFAKLLAVGGIPLTKTWACCYFVSYVVVFVMDNVLARFARDKKWPQDDPEAPIPHSGDNQGSDATAHGSEDSNRPLATVNNEQDTDPKTRDNQGARQRRRMSLDMRFGCVAMLLQLVALSFVDLAVITDKPADENPWLTHQFRFFRFLGTAVAVSIHYAFKRALGDNGKEFRVVPCVLSLFIVCLLTFMKSLTYTHLYLFWSIAIALGSWLLFLTPTTRSLVAPFGRGDWKNVASFDFFCRVASLSVFWYVKAYDPVGTYYPGWAQDVFG